ncbi:MAG: EAL domain-containing protein, partial [Cyanobacteria bacterium J06636_16]
VLSTYWDSAYELDLGPDGFLAYVNVKDNSIIAGEGFLPVNAQALMEPSPKGKIRVTYPIEGSEIYIVGEVSKSWALRNWQNLLFFGGPVAILSGSLLIVFLCQLLYSTQRLGYNLNQGLRRNEFRVYYQPIVDLQTGHCVGSEALLRWQHRRQGLLSPGIFVPIAEKTGLINKISEWLTAKVLEEQSQILEAYSNLYVSINLSPVQLNSGASDKLTRQLIERDDNLAKKVMFEITESTWIQDKETPALEAIARLRSLGMRIALDDFGTGHTGISYLHKLNFDYLKIDRIYTASSDAHSNIRIILDGIINLGRQLQVELIAEGVETEAQRQALLAKNVRYGQGYLFAYPMPIEEFEHFLRQNLS